MLRASHVDVCVCLTMRASSLPKPWLVATLQLTSLQSQHLKWGQQRPGVGFLEVQLNGGTDIPRFKG